MAMNPNRRPDAPRTPPPRSRQVTRPRKRRKKRSFLRAIGRFLLVCLFLGLLSLVILFWTPWGSSLRYLAADTLITTQHRHWAKYVIGQEELDRRVAAYSREFEQMGEEKDTHTIALPPETTDTTDDAAADDESADDRPLVDVEPISTSRYRGYVMTVTDPTKLRLGITATMGRGEKVSSMVKRTGAIAGVNAGGFADPNWMGNGFQPIGVVISGGELYYDGLGGAKSTQIVGIDGSGKMVAGKYTLSEMTEMGVKEAVSFQPRIIVNGKGLIKNASQGWGIAPRTAMGQRADGAILFVVIDGRQPGYSIGANLYDVQNIMLDHGAVIAANLDGGSSTVLVKDNEVLNRPANKQKERYLPTAWLVFDEPEKADIANIWQGLDPSDIDPGKW